MRFRDGHTNDNPLEAQIERQTMFPTEMGHTSCVHVVVVAVRSETDCCNNNNTPDGSRALTGRSRCLIPEELRHWPHSCKHAPVMVAEGACCAANQSGVRPAARVVALLALVQGSDLGKVPFVDTGGQQVG